MKKRKENPGKWISSDPADPQNPPRERSWLGRLAGTLNFVVVIIFLGAWITTFIFLNQSLSASTISGNLLTDLSCVSFFGGLIIAFIIAAIANNLLSRFLWKFPFYRHKDSKD